VAVAVGDLAVEDVGDEITFGDFGDQEEQAATEEPQVAVDGGGGDEESQDRKQALGGQLFALVQELHPTMAAKITGMILDNDLDMVAEVIMAHLPIHVRMGHALQKKERWAVGKHSPRDDIARARDLCRFIGDQIEMMQYIRGRVGDDRDAIPSLHAGQASLRPGLDPKASTLSKGNGRSEDAASKCAMEPASKRARTTEAQAQCSPSLPRCSHSVVNRRRS
jgi:hypothetical protein